VNRNPLGIAEGIFCAQTAAQTSLLSAQTQQIILSGNVLHLPHNIPDGITGEFF
jgi:hypothetical protein